MKKFLLKLSCVAVFSAIIVSNLNAQGEARNADLKKITSDECITLDGVADEYVWGQVEANAIDRDFTGHTPSFNSATWKSVWSEKGLYIVIEVDDDVWLPDFIDGYEGLGADGRGDLRPWNSDKPEIYLDASNPQNDGAAPSNRDNDDGNYQFADAWVAPESDDTYPYVGVHGATYFDSWDGEGKYVREFFIEWDSIRTGGEVVGIDDPLTWDGGKGAGVFGFDITLLDLDDVEGDVNRAVWKNTGELGESWNTFDFLGTITLISTVAQCQEAITDAVAIKKIPTGSEIIMDGEVDALWDNIDAVSIDKDFVNHTPSLDKAIWKAAWSDEGFYVLIDVEDDVWLPDFIDGHEGLGADGRGDLRPWNSDKPEIYFDASIPLKDGGAPSARNNDDGNYQFAEAWVAPESDGSYPVVAVHGTTYFDSWDGEGSYVREFYIPWDSVRTGQGAGVDPLTFDGGEGAGVFGFDITILDLDDVEGDVNRAVWENTGVLGESWNNLDVVGRIQMVDEEIVSSSIFENTNINNLKIAPTVTSNVINILQQDIDEVEIYSITGQVILTEYNKTTINVSSLNNGIYIIKATSSSGDISIARIIKK